jgi:hypothetical protein
MKRIWSILLICLAQLTYAQNILDVELKSNHIGKPLPIALAEIANANNGSIYYLEEWLQGLSFNSNQIGSTLGNALDQVFANTDLTFLSMYDNTLVILKDPTQALLRRQVLEQAIKEGKKIEAVKVGERMVFNVSENVTLQGQIVDWNTNEPLPFAGIQVNDSLFSQVSNQQGEFSLSIPQGLYFIKFTYLGYQEKVLDLEATADGNLKIEMEKQLIELDDIVVEATQNKDLAVTSIGKSVINMKELKRVPAFLGEADMVKQVQVQAGVTTVGEAATGFNVRGGSVDQNLILLDGLPIFNSSHVFGFLTSINPDAVSDVTFYKGGISARYGGRASSVLDIKTKDGNYEAWKVKAGIGLVTSNITANGPINDATSLTASARSTYSNWLVRSIRTNYADLRESSVFFYDASLKLTHLYSDKTKLSVTTYSSQDSFSISGDSTFQWSNFQASAKLDHQFSAELGSEFTLGQSIYKYKIINEDVRTASELAFQIATTTANADFHYDQGAHVINFGLQIAYYQFDPGRFKPNSGVSNAATISLDQQFALETALYIADEWTVNKKLFVEAGLRLPTFVSFGAATVNTYTENSRRSISDVNGILNFDKGEVIKSYVNLEPRLSARLLLNESSSLKIGYNRIFQYLHLVTNTAAATPQDIWQPSGYYFKPQRSDQISIGYSKEIQNKKYGITTEAYYKVLKNALDFKDGARLILNPNLETELLQGDGLSYGFETSVFKNEGRITGNINYTYSRAFRQINSTIPGRSINNGRRYSANFDQPHIVNLSWRYDLTTRHFFTGAFTYHTGRPVTIPLSAFNIEDQTVAFFSERNGYRIPDYHRLDLALVIEGNHKKTNRIKGTWVISVYNAYGRKNPYSVFFRNSGLGVPVPFQLSIIGTAFPSISYNLEF